MSDARIGRRKLLEQALAGRSLSLALLLELTVPVRELRAMCRRFGLTPKGGFRIDKAPAHVLAPLLAEQREVEPLEAALDAMLAHALPPAPAEPAAAAPDRASAPPADTRRADPELQRLQTELERARASGARALQRESDLRQQLERSEAQRRLLRGERERQGRRSAGAGGAARDTRELEQRVHDLEQELEGFTATDEALRRQLAVSRTRIRELEEQVAELDALLPKGKRRRKVVEPPPPADDRRFRLPYFTPAFYKSLSGKDRRSVERAIQAVLLFCTEGHAYPGLEVKQLGGQDTWSLRASLGLRVYFVPRDDGDIELLELADREDQRTALRRLKER